MKGIALLDACLTLSGNRLSGRMIGIRGLGIASNWIIRVIQTASCASALWSSLGIFEQTLSISILTAILFNLVSFALLLWFAVQRRAIKGLMKRLLLGSPSDAATHVRRIGATALTLVVALALAGSAFGGAAAFAMTASISRTAIFVLQTLPLRTSSWSPIRLPTSRS